MGAILFIKPAWRPVSGRAGGKGSGSRLRAHRAERHGCDNDRQPDSSQPAPLTELPPPTTASINALARADAGHYDELRGTAAASDAAGLTPGWSRFLGHLGGAGAPELNRRAARIERQLHDDGVTYNIHAEEARLQRPWPLELFPLLITPTDWQRIEAGVLQRVRVLDAVMRDLYGERRLLKDALLPAALVQGHPDYLRAMHGVPAVGGMHLHIVAFDLARGPDGNWWVVSQRTQAPSGLGYLLENRATISAQFTDAFEAMHVRRLAASYRRFIEALKAMAPGAPDAHIALLTPGPYNETYFEQSYLARYLGVTLVEGHDLTVRGQRLYLKTLHGLEPVHGLIKRVDDAFLDPLELRPESRLGVPGLLQAVRAGNLLVANAPGAAFLESSALLGFVPALARRLLGEELLLPALHTWWCGEPAALRDVLPRLGSCVIKPTYPWSRSRGTFGPGIGPLMRPDILDSWRDSIRRAPEEHTVQAWLPPAQMPTWAGRGDAARVQPRAAILRVFALSDGVGSWSVLPGGMTRLVAESAGLSDMALGGSSADTWVLGEAPAPADGGVEHGASLAAITPAATAQVQRERLVTSRAAENLFWLGRYTERAENLTRLAQITLSALHGDEEPSHALLMWLGQSALASGLVPAQGAAPPRQRAEFEAALVRHLGSGNEAPGLAHTLQALREAGAALRERLSTEHWSFIKDAQERFQADSGALRAGAAGVDALRVLAHLSRTLAAVTGAQHDRMWRDDGWRLLIVGRQIERLGWLCNALSRAFYTNAVHDAAGYGVVLDLFDSTISFHARHQRSRAIAALIEHVVLNHQNPRSIGWVLRALGLRLTQLHAHEAYAGLPELAARLPGLDAADLPRLCTSDAIGDFVPLQTLLHQLTDAADHLSDDIARRHFVHSGDVGRSLGA